MYHIPTILCYNKYIIAKKISFFFDPPNLSRP